MRLRIRNPFARPVTIRYWHAEAIVKRRSRGSIITKKIWFDGPSAESAGKGLRKIMLTENAKMHRALPIKQCVSKFYVPVWSLAFWWPPLEPKYMAKKGFALAS